MGALFHLGNDFVCDIGRRGMKGFERCFRRSAFEARFEGVELQGKGRHCKPKIHQFFYARISIHGLQGSRQNGEFGQLRTSVRQYRDRTTRVMTRLSAQRVNSGTASDADRDAQQKSTRAMHIRAQILR
jgi:hypothetical protein